MKNSKKALLLAVGFVAGLQAVRAQTIATLPALKLTGGYGYSRGSYGFATDTEVWTVPAAISYESESLLLRATVPYVTVKGPASVVGDTGPALAAPARPTTKSESGIGDVVLAATLHLNPASDSLKVDFTGRVKVPTADENKGLGTGQTDYYAQVDLRETFNQVTPFASGGYRFLGRSPAYQVKDGAYASGGLALHTGEGTSIGASYDWRSRLVDGGGESTDATVFLTHNPNDRWNVTLYALKGFDSGSPDFGFGGQISYRF